MRATTTVKQPSRIKRIFVYFPSVTCERGNERKAEGPTCQPCNFELSIWKIPKDSNPEKAPESARQE